MAKSKKPEEDEIKATLRVNAALWRRVQHRAIDDKVQKGGHRVQ